MLVRRGFRWLVGAAAAGLLLAVLLAGQVTQMALEQATLARLARDAAMLAAALPSPPPQFLPPGVLLLAADGRQIAGETAADQALPPELAAATAGRLAAAPLTILNAAGLLASHPVRAADGAVIGAIALWHPAARIEARTAGLLLRGVRDALVLFLLALPAAWIGARLLLAPLADAARGGAELMEALRTADLAAEHAATTLVAEHVLAAAPEGADPLVVAAAAGMGATLERLEATAAALLGAESAAALA